ncbi:chemotaxis protein [Shewanella sp. 125m-1]
MQIPPSIISGHNGFQAAQTDLTQATIDVAGASQSVAGTTTVDNVSMPSSTTQALVDATQAVIHAQASAEVIQIASDMIGSLINIKV